jgi:hypothetical protein
MITEDCLEELRSLCPAAKQAVEAGVDFVLLPALQLPDGCNPNRVDALLCLGARDGYDNRLFLSQQVSSPTPRNWNGQNVRILERNWFAFSWKVPSSPRPIATLLAHLQALR